MDGLDPLLLARIQFAANMTFHILFPTISISLGWVLLFFKLRYVKETVGNVAGPLLAYEVLTAFFLEATMLGIMLFGRERVSERVHTLATFLVAAGTSLSAFWILALNSWMHTPAGFEMIDGQAHVTSWLAVIFNPSFPYRFTHMMLASGLTVAFLVAGVSSYRWLRGDGGADVLASLKTGVYLAAVLIPLQIIAGDLHGLNTLEHQPAKVAAMEGIWETQKGAPAVLFAIPDAATRSNKFEIAIPKLASLYLTHDLNGEVKGINDFKGVHPPVGPVFWAFRIMVGTGLLMLAVSWLCTWQLRPWKGMVPKLFASRNTRASNGAAASAVWQNQSRGPGLEGPRPRELKRWQARVLVAMTFAGWLALIAGWYTTEIGRQPWLVSGILTAADAASNVTAPRIALTLALYLTLYAALIVAYISVVFYLARHRVHADQPFGDADLEDQPNVINYPEKEAAPGPAHA